MSNTIYDGKWVSILNVNNDFNREILYVKHHNRPLKYAGKTGAITKNRWSAPSCQQRLNIFLDFGRAHIPPLLNVSPFDTQPMYPYQLIKSKRESRPTFCPDVFWRAQLDKKVVFLTNSASREKSTIWWYPWAFAVIELVLFEILFFNPLNESTAMHPSDTLPRRSNIFPS